MFGYIILLIIVMAIFNVFYSLDLHENIRASMTIGLFYCLIRSTEDYRYHEYKQAVKYLVGVIVCIVVIALSF